MKLESSNSRASVEFSEVEADWFRISVVAPEVSAQRRVYAFPDALGVARLFAEAANEWKGWNKPMVWQSLEGELRLELTIDGHGHVTLTVCIRSDAGGADPWQLDAAIGLDAGQLESIARTASRLWSNNG